MAEGVGEKGKKKVLGKDVILEQAREGVGDIMCGKRKRLKGKRRKGGREEKSSEKNRVKELEQARFMDSWARRSKDTSGSKL